MSNGCRYSKQPKYKDIKYSRQSKEDIKHRHRRSRESRLQVYESIDKEHVGRLYDSDIYIADKIGIANR